MKLIVYFLLLVLPVACIPKTKPVTKYYNSVSSPYKKQLNTAVLFSPPPHIQWLRDTIFNISNHMVKACITNIRSVNNIQLTLNGEEQLIIPQSTNTFEATCRNGYYFTYELILNQNENIIKLEARNEGGATIRYLAISVTK